MTTGQKNVAVWVGVGMAALTQIVTVAALIGGLSARMVNVETQLIQVRYDMQTLLRRP